MTRPTPAAPADFPVRVPLATRWADNDIYGHVNNVTYYSYFDTAVNQLLIGRGALDIHGGAVIGLVVETGCQFFAPAAFPDVLDIGIRVAHLGRSSVRYELGVFRPAEASACAQGFFVHVYVDRQTRRPVGLPPELRQVLAELQTEGTQG